MEDRNQQHRLRIAAIFAILFAVFGIIILYSGASILQSQVTRPKDAQQNTHRADMYPNPALTPGDIFPGVTKETICVTGYTKTVRDVPLSLKKEIYAEYNVSYPQPTGAYEVDHFIPLALGGSNDPKNLWPEPALPTPGFHEKDVAEVYLIDQVCHHNLDLKIAQDEIRTDWYTVYESIPNKSEFIY